MTHPAIKVEGLWKEYVVGSAEQRNTTFYDMLASAFRSPLRRLRRLGGQAPEAERFRALRDVGFESDGQPKQRLSWHLRPTGFLRRFLSE
jgi:hypothetical protein